MSTNDPAPSPSGPDRPEKICLPCGPGCSYAVPLSAPFEDWMLCKRPGGSSPCRADVKSCPFYRTTPLNPVQKQE